MPTESTAIYLRVSTDEQKERQTIETQRREANLYCELRRLGVQAVYEDDGVSGTVPFHERPQGAALWRDIASGKVKSVLVYRIDRIARRVIHTLSFVEHAERHGTKIYSVTEQVDLTSAMGRLMLTIAAAFAENERAVIRERSMAGRRRRAAGGRVSSHAPYGYLVEDGALVVDESRAGFVQSLFRWYAEGAGPQDIVLRLTEAGAPPPRGRRWRNDTLIYMLKQRAYVGEYHHYKTKRRDAQGRRTVAPDPSERIVVPCPAIIDRALFDAAQEQMRENSTRGPASRDRTYLLRGLVRCGTCPSHTVYCGHTVTGRRYTAKDGRVINYPEFRYYECGTLTNRDYEFCGGARVNANDLERTVWGEIESFLRQPSKVIDRLLERHREQAGDSFDTTRRLVRLDRQLGKNDQARRRIVHAIGRGTITHEDASDELQSLSADRNRLLLERGRVEDGADDREARKRQINSAREMLLALSARLDEGIGEEEKVRLVRQMVAGITVHTVTDEAGRKRPHAVIQYVFEKPEEDVCFGNGGFASSDSSRKKWKMRPRNSREPGRVRRLTRPPDARPYSAENWLVMTCTSSTASAGGWKRSRADRSSLLSRPSVVTLFE